MLTGSRPASVRSASTSSMTAAGSAKAPPRRSSLDGRPVGEAKIPQTVVRRFSLDETFDVGEDTVTPVIDDYAGKMPFKFTGKLNKVTIELKDDAATTGAR